MRAWAQYNPSRLLLLKCDIFSECLTSTNISRARIKLLHYAEVTRLSIIILHHPRTKCIDVRAREMCASARILPSSSYRLMDFERIRKTLTSASTGNRRASSMPTPPILDSGKLFLFQPIWPRDPPPTFPCTTSVLSDYLRHQWHLYLAP